MEFEVGQKIGWDSCESLPVGTVIITEANGSIVRRVGQTYMGYDVWEGWDQYGNLKQLLRLIDSDGVCTILYLPKEEVNLTIAVGQTVGKSEVLGLPVGTILLRTDLSRDVLNFIHDKNQISYFFPGDQLFSNMEKSNLSPSATFIVKYLPEGIK